MTGAPFTPWTPSRTKGFRARTPFGRVWCSVRQYAYHAMRSLRIAPGPGAPFRFCSKLRAYLFSVWKNGVSRRDERDIYYVHMNSKWGADNLQLLLREKRRRVSSRGRSAAVQTGRVIADGEFWPVDSKSRCRLIGLIDSELCTVASGGALLQGCGHCPQHIPGGRGFPRPDLKLAGSLVNEHLNPGDDREPLRAGHLQQVRLDRVVHHVKDY